MASEDTNTQKDHGAKKKTPFQILSLQKFYSEDAYPTQKAMEAYATSLDLTYNQIRIWFVERRRKERKEISALFTGHEQVRQKEKRPALSKRKKYSSAGQRETIAYNSKCGRPCTPESTRLLKKYRQLYAKNQFVSQKDRRQVLRPCLNNFTAGNDDHEHKKQYVRLQVLFSKDYILKRVFRKDGPHLGVEFDPLPANAFHADSKNLYSSRSGQRNPKRRKVMKSPVLETEPLHGRNIHEKKHGIGKGLMAVWHATNFGDGSPVLETGPLHGRNIHEKKHGIGKGLMTVWHATNSGHGVFPTGIDFIGARATRSSAASKETLCQVSKVLQQLKMVPKKKPPMKKLQEKRKPAVKRKVQHSKVKSSNELHPKECKLSAGDLQSLEQSNVPMTLVDDEELELRESQSVSNPLRCSVHLASIGRHGCSLCKDLLAKFPPQMVKMKQPFSTRPWDSSPVLVKKLFKVVRFLYSHAMAVEVCSFTLDEFAQAFHDKDSLLLGKIHVAVLKMLLAEVEREVTAGFIPRASKDCRFLGFLHFVREQEFDVKFWCQSLNPLTWTEILRQVLIAAGFGSKNNSMRREMLSKERNQMSKYGLRHRTLKGELFCMLSEKGIGGLKVSEMANASQIIALDLPSISGELEQLICSTLSSDITLFEKIAPSVYRLRVDPHIKGKEDSQSDTDDSGSVDDDDSRDTSRSSSDESDDSEERNSAVCEQRTFKFKARYKKGQKLTEYTEIDESYSGAAWVLGLMEGEYSNLSIVEKLDALEALVDLAGAGCSLRIEEPVRAITGIIPDTRNHGSGAKIKKSSADHHLTTRELWAGPAYGVEHSSSDFFPVNPSEISSKASKKGHSSAKIKNTETAKESGPDVHPLQSIYLGSDRRYNSYWLFLGPCNANDPGHRRVYFESSEDGHWEVIDTAQALHALLSVLDVRGSRESRLLASLEAREAVLSHVMADHMTAVTGCRQTRGSNSSDLDHNIGDASSPISDLDNILVPSESTNSRVIASGVVVLELGKNDEEKKQKWDRLQAFDRWIWESFYSTLNVVRNSRRSFMESLARCWSCHDLYWRDEKHCKICHSTFEVDFDLEERYAIHVATCRETEHCSEFPNHKVLPSQLQALKGAIHAIEMGLPEAALAGAWTKSGHKLWVKRLRRTSSLAELLQVLTDFVSSINEEWLYGCSLALGSRTASMDEILVNFQTMPQTTSAVALWMVKLDMLVAPHFEGLDTERIKGSKSQPKRRRTCGR